MSPEQIPVLSSDVRRRILEHLNVVAGQAPPGAPTGRSAADLAAYLGLHVTTVRFHLDQLVTGGYLVTAFERTPRVGRPRKLYAAPHLDPDAETETQRHYHCLLYTSRCV